MTWVHAVLVLHLLWWTKMVLTHTLFRCVFWAGSCVGWVGLHCFCAKVQWVQSACNARNLVSMSPFAAKRNAGRGGHCQHELRAGGGGDDKPIISFRSSWIIQNYGWWYGPPCIFRVTPSLPKHPPVCANSIKVNIPPTPCIPYL